MDQNAIDKNIVEEQYVITDIAIFAIIATMLLLLLMNCLLIYTDSKSTSGTYLLHKVKKIEANFSNKIDKSIMKIQLFEEKILNILKNNKEKNKHLYFKRSIDQISNITNSEEFEFYPSKKYLPVKKDQLQKNRFFTIEDFKPKLHKKDCHIIIYNNDIFICKNIIFNNKFFGTIVYKALKISFEKYVREFERDRNISELFITDYNSNSCKLVDKASKNKDIAEMVDQFNTQKLNFIGVWVNIFTGENIALKRLQDYVLVIGLRMNEDFVKNKIYSVFVSRLIEVVGFISFFLILMILIVRKDRIRNEYTQKLKDDAIYANKAKSDFLAYTAHEIRSPLGFVLTGTEMIKAGLLGPISDKCKEYIEGINLNAQSILNFITEILDENKILQNKFSLTRDYHDITKILIDVIKHNETKFYSKKITVITDFEENLPLLYCDDKKIYQIANNLITNSCKYSKGDIIINIKVFIDTKKLFIKIEDNGIGMDEKEIKIAMKRYESVNFDSNSDSYGLGLSIVKLLIDAHEARFYLTSEKNVGTTVTIVFNQKFLKY